MPKLQCQICKAQYWPTELAVVLHPASGSHQPVYKVVWTRQERKRA